ncbi:MAG: ATP phosphoribosyltransferase regulatory subunit, partial [SAR202 cluster bacterium]|nr:ATP phosphoribosyltransferase regulatory subunit [SAR202 cluster bacterium]
MSQKQFQAPRGTSDILPEEQVYWRFLESRAEEVASRFGYERINTPAFENANLFVRSVGEATDIVEKETYTFEDRGGDLVSLRPEGTAPVCRAYLQHGMHNLPQPVRLFYVGDFFRYDRPQAGRYRQFHQFGIEVIGESDASVDSEVIDLAWSVLESVGVKDVTLLLNSIGDAT